MHLIEINNIGLIEGVNGLMINPSALRQLRMAIELTLEMYKTEEISDEEVEMINQNLVNGH